MSGKDIGTPAKYPECNMATPGYLNGYALLRETLGNLVADLVNAISRLLIGRVYKFTNSRIG